MTRSFLSRLTASIHDHRKGAYRTAFLVEKTTPGIGRESFAYKRLREHAFDYSDAITGIRAEAEAMEATTASSSVLGIFGYCQYSVLVETGSNATTLYISMGSFARDRLPFALYKKRSDSREEAVRRREFKHRLDLVTQAAQGLLDLHSANYTHNDIKADQFLVFNHTKVLLNDFNRARRKLVWDPSANQFKTRWRTAKKSGGKVSACSRSLTLFSR